jgi:hypothetical protein
VLGLAAAVALFPIQGITWDGGFPSMEYRLTFTDGTGRPVPGVELRVLTQAGGLCHLYPIDEFLPDQAPTSDAEGRMVFHHTGESVEFGGREFSNLFGKRFGETDNPQYVCVFAVAGGEVHRVRYDDLRSLGGRDLLPTVTRAWQRPDWPMREYVAHHDEWSARRLRLFDGNGDGRLDREERTAAAYFEWVLERAEFDHGKRDIEFLVVARTITVSVP